VASEVDGADPAGEPASLPQRTLPQRTLPQRTPAQRSAADPVPPLDTRESQVPPPTPGHDGAAADPGPTEGTVYTPAGLPWRVRQPSPTRPLRDEPAAPEDADGEPVTPRTRPPEEIRQMMASYQSGTRRGRSAATAGTPDTSPAGEPGDPTPA
jgi:hypothetical protein